MVKIFGLTKTVRLAVLLGGAAVTAGAQSLPPVRLCAPVNTTPPATDAAAGGAPAAGARGQYAQPKPGQYAQPAAPPAAQPGSAPAAPVGASSPAAAAGVYLQPRPGGYAQPSQSVPASTASPTDGGDIPQRKVSLGFAGGEARGAAPANVNVLPPSERDSVRPTAEAGRSSLPPPRLFGAERESGGELPAAVTPIAKASRVPERARPLKKAKPAPPKEPELVVIPGKPLLDEYGVQRVDPSGKPMFTAETRQARDKHGKPLFDAEHKPVFQTADDPGYDARGHRIKLAKAPGEVKAPQVTIEHGAFTVDGIVGKVQLNYDIGEMHYLYLYVPDTGVAVVSPNPFPGATVQRGAFRENVLTVKTEEHTLAVSSAAPFFGKKPVDAYVMVDRGFLMPGAKFPVFGYGNTTREPYVWPGSKAEEKMAGVSDYAPPVPKDLKPKLVGERCATGQTCPESGKPAASPGPVPAPAKPNAATPGAP